MGHLRQRDTVHLHQLCVLPRTQRKGSNETSREERDGEKGDRAVEGNTAHSTPSTSQA